MIKVKHKVKSLGAKDEHGLVIVRKLSHLQMFFNRMDTYLYAVISHRSITILSGDWCF